MDPFFSSGNGSVLSVAHAAAKKAGDTIRGVPGLKGIKNQTVASSESKAIFHWTSCEAESEGHLLFCASLWAESKTKQ